MKKQNFFGGDNNFDSDSDSESDSENLLITDSDSGSDGVGIGFRSSPQDPTIYSSLSFNIDTHDTQSIREQYRF